MNKNVIINKNINNVNNKYKNIRHNLNNYNLNEIDILVNIKENNINKKIYFLNDKFKLDELNTELYINEEKKEYQNYFIPQNEGNYNIKLKFFENIKDCSFMFAECKNIINIDFTRFNTKYLTNMNSMFANCTLLKNINIFSFETRNVINMNFMFYKCVNLNSLDFSSLVNKNVNNMKRMLYNCDKINVLNLFSFDTKNNKNINKIFGSFHDLNNYEILPQNYEHYNIIFTISNIGDSGSLKTRLIELALYNKYDIHLPPIGYDLYYLSIRYKSKIIKIQIIDTGEQDLYFFANEKISLSLSTSLYLFVYAINDIGSFNTIENRINKIKNNVPEKAILFLIGNKIDISEEE